VCLLKWPFARSTYTAQNTQTLYFISMYFLTYNSLMPLEFEKVFIAKVVKLNKSRLRRISTRRTETYNSAYKCIQRHHELHDDLSLNISAVFFSLFKQAAIIPAFRNSTMSLLSITGSSLSLIYFLNHLNLLFMTKFRIS
jgi:hypothetical protein